MYLSLLRMIMNRIGSLQAVSLILWCRNDDSHEEEFCAGRSSRTKAMMVFVHSKVVQECLWVEYGCRELLSSLFA